MKIFIVLAGLLLAMSVRSLPPINTFTFCNGKADGYHCASCLQPVYCNATNVPSATALPTCLYYYVCEEYSTTLAYCEYYSQATYCDCTPSSTICDSYNENYIVECDSHSRVNNVTLCDRSLQEVCRADTCFARQCSGIANGTSVRYYPACNTGYQCVGDVYAEITCEDNQYLSDNGTCLSAPPTPCANNCSGNCPDETDCTRYYFCDGQGTVLGGAYICEENSFFNPLSNPPLCVANDTSVCAPLTACDF